MKPKGFRNENRTSTAPFFILANPRSGSSLFRLMLNSHELITVPPECGFAVWLKDRYFDADFSGTETRVEFANDLYNARKFETWGVTVEQVLQKIEPETHRTYPDVVLAIYEIYAENQGKAPRIFGDKNNFYVNHVPVITEIFPEARLIHLVRDGRDIAASFRELDQKKITSRYAPPSGRGIRSIAEEWVKTNNEIQKHATSSLMQVRYEDLVASPKSTIAEVCAFLSVPYSAAIESFYLHNDEPEEFLQWKEKTRHDVMSTQVSRYRRDLNEQEIAQFEDVAGPMLAQYGYDL